MNSSFTHTACTVVRFRRPPQKRLGAAKSGFALRLEGSLAAVATLAPVIPIFPDLASASAPASEQCHLLNDIVPWAGSGNPKSKT